MSTNQIFLSEEGFNFSNVQNLSLCVEVGFNSFTACVLDEKTSKVNYGEYIEFSSLNDVEKESKVLHQNFNNVYVSVSNSDFTLIPKAIFNDEILGDYLKLNLGENKQSEDAFKLVDKSNCIDAYRIPTEISQFFKGKFQQTVFTHSSHTFLNLIQISEIDNNSIFIHAYPENFLISYFKDRKLQLLNSFDFKTKEDFIYLVLFLLKELGIKQQDVLVQFSGNIDLGKTLNDYVKEVKSLNTKVSDLTSIDNRHHQKFILSSFVHKCV